jgi:hypothetical protein
MYTRSHTAENARFNHYEIVSDMISAEPWLKRCLAVLLWCEQAHSEKADR